MCTYILGDDGTSVGNKSSLPEMDNLSESKKFLFMMHKAKQIQIDKAESAKSATVQKIAAKNGVVGALKNSGKDVKGGLKRLSDHMVDNKDTPSLVKNFRKGFGTPSTVDSARVMSSSEDDDSKYSPLKDDDSAVTKGMKNKKRKQNLRKDKINNDEEEAGYESLMKSILSDTSKYSESSGIDTDKIIKAMKESNETLGSTIQLAFTASISSLAQILKPNH